VRFFSDILAKAIEMLTMFFNCHLQEKEFSERRIVPQIHTIEDRTGDKFLSTWAEDVGNDCSLDRERKRAETPVEYESDVVIEDFYGLELQDWESEHEPQYMVDYVHVLKGHAISGNESVAEPRYYALAKDSPLPCDESWDVVDKSTIELLKKETNAAAKILPPAITSFTRDQIISKNCCFTYAMYGYFK
jgi:hypothetical protein